MKIIWTECLDPTWKLIRLNEAYFRFEFNEYRRVDCEGENNENALSQEQKIFCMKLISLSINNEPIFKKVLFNGNELMIQLMYPWKSEYEKIIEEYINETLHAPYIKAKS